MILSQLGIGSVVLGFLVRTRPACLRRLLRLARRKGGRLYVADAAHRLRLPPARAQELLDELVHTGVAQRDPSVHGLYLFAME